MHSLFNSNTLEVRQGRHSKNRLDFSCQGPLTGTNSQRRITQGKSIFEFTARPLFKFVNNRIRVNEMVRKDVGRLQGARIYNEVPCDKFCERGTLLPNQMQSQVDMTKGGSGGYKFPGLHNHL